MKFYSFNLHCLSLQVEIQVYILWELFLTHSNRFTVFEMFEPINIVVHQRLSKTIFRSSTTQLFNVFPKFKIIFTLSIKNPFTKTGDSVRGGGSPLGISHSPPHYLAHFSCVTKRKKGVKCEGVHLLAFMQSEYILLIFLFVSVCELFCKVYKVNIFNGDEVSSDHYKWKDVNRERKLKWL